MPDTITEPAPYGIEPGTYAVRVPGQPDRTTYDYPGTLAEATGGTVVKYVGTFALVLTHPDGTHTLTEHPTTAEADRIAGLAVHTNRDAVSALIIGPTGRSTWTVAR